MTALRIGIGFQLTTYTGWGIVGMNIALQLSALSDVELFISANTDLRGVNPLDALRLAPRMVQTLPEIDVLLTAEGNACGGPPDVPCRHMGLMVFEDTSILSDPEKLANLRKYDWLVTASKWNHDLLAAVGVPSALIQQGIDPTTWHPAPRSGRHKDRFIVFSGGKLEYRKGQDIVLAAFREFQSKHPEALLVTAWGNHWTDLAVDMTLNGWVSAECEVIGGRLDIEGWGEDNGLPAGSHVDVGMLPNVMLAPIVREADVAVFASRAEGGTNLMAMEAIAAGVPTIVSNNTGHKDLPCLRLAQGFEAAKPAKFFGAVDTWGETEPGMLSEALEFIRDGSRPPTGPVPTWAEHTNQLVQLIRGNTVWNLDTDPTHAST